jgi:hypothetical protein
MKNIQKALLLCNVLVVLFGAACGGHRGRHVRERFRHDPGADRRARGRLELCERLGLSPGC